MPLSFGCTKGMVFPKSALPGAPLTIVIDTSLSTGTTFDINIQGASGSLLKTFTPSFTINWGDGLTQSFTTTGLKSRTYATGGVYTIEISGRVPGIGWQATLPGTNAKKMTGVTSWGQLTGLSTLAGFASNSSITTNIPSNIPASVLNLSYFFYGAAIFNGSNVVSWDTSRVVTTQAMFFSAPLFNQNIGSWNVSNVTNMTQMFQSATAFNNGGSDTIKNWDVSRVTTLESTFVAANAFNQPIGSWNTSSLTYLYQTFFNAIAFNQPVNNWDVSRVTNLGRFARGATAFNQPLNNWNVSACTSFFEMFASAPSFNQNLGSFNILQRADMRSFFGNAPLSPENYSRTLISWANQIANAGTDYRGKGIDIWAGSFVKYNSTNYGGSPYNNAVDAKAYLDNNNTICQPQFNITTPLRNIVCSSNGLICLAAGGGGYLQKSTDGGVTWSNIVSVGTSSSTWSCAAMSADGTKMAACISSGAIYTSSDSGANWTLRSNAGNRVWGCIAISSDGASLAAGVVAGFMYTSGDSGATWTQRSVSTNWVNVSMSTNGTKLVAVSSSGYVYTSSDSGANWTARITDLVRVWGSCACSSDGSIMYVVENAVNGVRKSTDSGATWLSTTTTGVSTNRTISCSADGSRLIMLYRGSSPPTSSGIAYSSNSGLSWTFKDIGPPGANTTLRTILGANYDMLTHAAMSDDGQRIIFRANLGGYLRGHPITYSTDNGATWAVGLLTGYSGAGWRLVDGGAG